MGYTMNNRENMKAEIEKKEKELEELRKRSHTPKDNKCGGRHHRDSPDLWIEIEELEEEIKELKKRLKN